MKTIEIALKLTVLCSAIIFLSGCASMSTMQTARTVEKNEVGYGFGGGVVNSEFTLGELDTISINAPFVEGSARYGITENLDVGLKLTIIGTGVADAKYQFLGDDESTLAASAGLGLGYMSIESGGSKANIYDIMLPGYFSFHPLKWLSLYTGPKYVYRINSYTSNGTSDSQTSHWYGTTGGIRIGKNFGVLLEYSYFGNSAASQPFSQITGGISIGIR